MSHPLRCYTILRPACLNTRSNPRSKGRVSLLHTLSWNTPLVRPVACQSAVHQSIAQRPVARQLADYQSTIRYPAVHYPTVPFPAVRYRSLTTGSSATTTMEGSCLCKAIELKVTDDNLFGSQRRGHLCHCSNCRKVAGGLFGANLAIEEEKVEWVRGRDVVKVYEDRDTLSGKPVYRHFCPDCGVPIMSVAESMKGKVILKLGIYSKLPVPEWESFAEDRQAWEKPYDGCVQFKKKSHGEKMEGSP